MIKNVAQEDKSTTRRPRFKRGEEIAFRLTDDDVVIIIQCARHRFLKSTHIAALTNRSQDRVNDRLLRLFHAGFLDRPRAQLDRQPDSGSSPIVYALADKGARLLFEQYNIPFTNFEITRKNNEAKRPFIEHQLSLMDFYVSLEVGLNAFQNHTLLHKEDIIANAPHKTRELPNPSKLSVPMTVAGQVKHIGLIADILFGVNFPDKSKRCFFVEIDRGTMPVLRTNELQTSFAKKMQCYLTTNALKLQEKQFNWKAFRVLVVTTDESRMQTMMQALRTLKSHNGLGATLFFFTTFERLQNQNPLTLDWFDGTGKKVKLI